MRSISELIKEINNLPSGKVYLKTINGKKYYYHQYFYNGKRYSEIVKREDLSSLEEKINKRIELESELKRLKSNDSNNIVLSENAKKLTGQVMMGDTPVAKFNNGVLIEINESLAPLIIKRTHQLEPFLKYRTIDSTRVNSRLIKKALNINDSDEKNIPLYSYALSIGDNYWFKPKNSKLRYKDVNFNNDLYFDISLKGDTSLFPRHSKITPELTTTGSYEKGWKRINNEWWLYKNGNKEEIFSELFCYHFASLIGVKTATYEYDEGYIRSKNFADSLNFEPIVSLVGENDDYNIVFPLLYELNKDIAKDYLKLMMFDAVINNVDRHNENYGVLRDKRNGLIVSLAPNFDNNISLISRNEIVNPNPKKDGLISLFTSFLTNNVLAFSLYKEIEFKEINKEDIIKIIDSIPLELSDNTKENITEAVMNRYQYLKSL